MPYTIPLYAISPSFDAALFAGKEISRSTLPANQHTTFCINNKIILLRFYSYSIIDILTYFFMITKIVRIWNISSTIRAYSVIIFFVFHIRIILLFIQFTVVAHTLTTSVFQNNLVCISQCIPQIHGHSKYQLSVVYPPILRQ